MIICFDLDGTLLNTNKWILDSQIKAYKKNNIKYTKKQLYSMWGLTLGNQTKLLKPTVTKKELKKIGEDFHEIRFATIKTIKPYKNVKKILKKLSKSYTLCLLSNNRHSSLIKLLETTKIDPKLFHLIIGVDDVKHPKPFPDEIYLAEKKLKKKVQFMVGDTQQDIKTAKAAKVKSIIVLNSPKQTWKTLNNANFKIKDISEIPSLINEVSK
jgi:HAD superfamily hydrolase (TIGR01549 family)